MKTEALLKVLDGLEQYDKGVRVLEAGSIDRAMEVSRYCGRPFMSLPKHAQAEILDLAKFLEL